MSLYYRDLIVPTMGLLAIARRRPRKIIPTEAAASFLAWATFRMHLLSRPKS